MNFILRVGLSLLFIVLAPLYGAWAAVQENFSNVPKAIVASLNVRLEKEIRPWLDEHCTSCHGGENPEAKLDLTKKFKLDHIVDSPDRWRGMLRRVESGEMPPADTEVLEPADRAVFERWLQSALFDVACAEIAPPRSPALRRLTRFEYQRAVHELTGISFDSYENFPADEVGHGFDNIADLLNLSPLLTEKYLSAAETIAAKAIVDPSEMAIDRAWNGAELEGSQGTRPIEQDQILTTRGQLQWELNVRAPGKYKITVEAFGQHAGEGWIEMGLVVDGVQIATEEVKSRRDRPSMHPFTANLKPGRRRLGVSFNNDFYDPQNPDKSKRDRNLIVCHVRVTGPSENQDLPGGPRQSEIIFILPDGETKTADAAKQVLTQLARRAYRRPPNTSEVQRLLDLFDQQTAHGASFEGALRTCLTAILVSPNFLFRIEAIPGPGQTQRLTDFEMASALAFFLWSEPPDEELIRLAESGRLLETSVLDSQIERMVKHDKFAAWLDNFVEQWLHLRLLDQFDPDPKSFGDFDTELVRSMKGETKKFIHHLVVQNRPIKEIAIGDFTFVDKRLAALYGLPIPESDSFVYVGLGDMPRRGIVTQASFLALTSNPNRTSPVKRGKWILENLIGHPPPPPLPDVASLDNQQRLTGTLREKMEQHRQDPNCASCHLKMDAIGFALERFDPIGRLRAEDDGRPIDDRGDLPGGVVIDGAIELAEVLGKDYERQIARCFLEKMLTFAVGRGLELHDDRVVAKIMSETEGDQFRAGDLLRAIIHSDSFQVRSGGQN